MQHQNFEKGKIAGYATTNPEFKSQRSTIITLTPNVRQIAEKAFSDSPSYCSEIQQQAVFRGGLLNNFMFVTNHSLDVSKLNFSEQSKVYILPAGAHRHGSQRIPKEREIPE
jgi:hypothetical protein